MATQVGVGLLATTTGRARTRKLRNDMENNNMIMRDFKKHGGFRKIPGGRSILYEMAYAQNPTPTWVGEAGQVSLQATNELDAAEYLWKYQLGSVTFTIAEQRMNSGGDNIKFIDLVGGKYMVLESSMRNDFQVGLLSNGSGYGGLQIGGLALLLSKTPDVGEVGGINRASADAAFYRNYAFDTTTDWTGGPVSAATVKTLYDKVINNTIRLDDRVKFGIAGETHYEALSLVGQTIQRTMKSDEARIGYDSDAIIYRGIPFYYGGGISFSGADLVQSDLTYFINPMEKGLEIVFQEDSFFDLLEEKQSMDQAVMTQLIFNMCAMGGNFLRGSGVLFDS
jgi:hypothetical protein